MESKPYNRFNKTLLSTSIQFGHFYQVLIGENTGFLLSLYYLIDSESNIVSQTERGILQ